MIYTVIYRLQAFIQTSMRVLPITSLKPKLTSATKMYMYRAIENNKLVRAVKLKPKAMRHLKVDPVLKINETFYKRNLCVHTHTLI